MSALRDSAFNKRRTINGIRVLVNALPNATGVTSENFAVRIKYPSGNKDTEVRAFYYWEAFNYAKNLLSKSK